MEKAIRPACGGIAVRTTSFHHTPARATSFLREMAQGNFHVLRGRKRWRCQVLFVRLVRRGRQGRRAACINRPSDGVATRVSQTHSGGVIVRGVLHC
jgi:hypothetical protein